MARPRRRSIGPRNSATCRGNPCGCPPEIRLRRTSRGQNKTRRATTRVAPTGTDHRCSVVEPSSCDELRSGHVLRTARQPQKERLESTADPPSPGATSRGSPVRPWPEEGTRAPSLRRDVLDRCGLVPAGVCLSSPADALPLKKLSWLQVDVSALAESLHNLAGRRVSSGKSAAKSPEAVQPGGIRHSSSGGGYTPPKGELTFPELRQRPATRPQPPGRRVDAAGSVAAAGEAKRRGGRVRQLRLRPGLAGPDEPSSTDARQLLPKLPWWLARQGDLSRAVTTPARFAALSGSPPELRGTSLQLGLSRGRASCRQAKRRGIAATRP